MLGLLFYQKICTQWPSTWAQTGVEAVEDPFEGLAEGGVDWGGLRQVDKSDLRMRRRRHRHRHLRLRLRCLCQSNLGYHRGDGHKVSNTVGVALVADHEPRIDSISHIDIIWH